MELNAFLARLFTASAALGLSHVLSRAPARSQAQGKPATADLARLASFVLALGLIPVVDPVLLGSLGPSSLAGVWTLFWLGAVLSTIPSTDRLEKLATSGQWLIAWGFSLACPLTVFGHLDLDSIAEAQDRLILDLLPGWGVCIQPLAFAVCLWSLAAWKRAQGEEASLRMTLRLPIAVVVAVFLGGWHLPWVSDSTFAEVVGYRVWILLPLQILLFALKSAALEAGVRRLAITPRAFPPWLDALKASGAAGVLLVLTWLWFWGRGA